MDEQFQCTRCVMDRTATEIEFTDTGCTFCDLAMKMKPGVPDKKVSELIWKDNEREYDVLLGLSGGVDSSYCLHLLNKMGIKVLAYSLDNGYNTPQADENVMKLVEGMRIPFFRYTIDLDRFMQLQTAFMAAGLKNLEIPTDHILMATSYEVANTYGIKTIISGGNWATESIMPQSWGYQPRDLTHMRDVYRKSTGKTLSGLPMCGLWKYNYYRHIKKIKVVNLLDYFKYNRQEAIKTLEKEYGFQPYGEKHTENYFTWWFMNYYLFEKWGIDKRKAHLSSEILSGQITRDEALAELEKNPVYPTLGIETRVMKYPKREYTQFKTDEKLWNFISKVIRYVNNF